MKRNNTNESSRILLIITGISVLSLIGMRLFFASRFSHPGHGDFAHYYNLAVNLFNGRGLVVDYIWDYLRIYKSITHIPLYWMPLASVLMALFFHLTGGPSVYAGILLSVITLALTVIVTGIISRKEHPQWNSSFHLAVMLLVAALPLTFTYSLLTDAVIYNTLLITIGIFLLGAFLDTGKPVYLYSFSFFAVLVYYTRGDGLIFTGSAFFIFLFVLYGKETKRRKLLIHGGLAALFYFLLVHPYSAWIEKNTGGNGTGPLSLFFATSYNDLFMWGITGKLNFRTWLEAGILSALEVRLEAATTFILYLFKISLGTILLAPLMAFLSVKNPRGRRFYIPMLLHGAFLFGAYTFLLPFSGMGGSFNKSITALYPLWSLAVFAEARHLLELLSDRFDQKGALSGKFFKKLGILSFIIIIAFFTIINVEKGFEMVEENTEIDKYWSQAAGILPPGTPVICPEPWECYFSTGYPSVITPSNDWNDVFTVAGIYKVDYVILEKGNTGATGRKFSKLTENLPDNIKVVYETDNMEIVALPKEKSRS